MTSVRRTRRRTSHIARDDAILGGEPIVRGTRIAVRSVVLAAREYGGVSGALRAYPHLIREAAQDALWFYEAHRDEIERYIAENTADD